MNIKETRVSAQSPISNTYFGSYLMSERLKAFLSIVLLIVSVSDALCAIGVGLVLVELAEPPDVMFCDAERRFPPRFDSSNALRASWVSADGLDFAGNN